MKQPAFQDKPADAHPKPDLSKGYAAVFATVFIWSLPSLFMYYLNRFYDPWAQNFYRYSVACIAIAPLVLWNVRRGGPAIDMRAVRLCLLPCLPNVVHQVTQVMALFYMGPGVYAIFTRASVIFTALLALAFFPEERFVIRQWQFQLGTLLGLIGAFGVIWFQANAQSQDRHIALPGLFIAFTATFCWALYGVLIKRPSAQLGPIRSFGLDQLHHFRTAVSPHPRVWQDRHTDPRRRSCQPHSDHLRCHLHHACPRFVLCSNPRNRSRAGPSPPASLSRDRDGALRLDFPRTPYSCSALERGCSAPRRIPCHARETSRHE